MDSDLSQDIVAVAELRTVPTILEVVCRLTGMGFAAVARVTETRWIACAVKDDIGFGLKPGGELKIETTICNEIRDSGTAVIIDHVEQDNLYCTHHTPKLYGFQSYISVPIVRADGSFFGTLCAIDPRPNRLNTPLIVETFEMFADVIAKHLDTVSKLAYAQDSLQTATRDSGLREQFIAVLGHDLRNPLANIDAGLTLLTKRAAQPPDPIILRGMEGSVGRMTALIDNMLDFARGRLGGGVPLAIASAALKPALEQVIDELHSANPSRPFNVELNFNDPIACDQMRIAQLLSNLVGNSILHGAPGTPIVIRAEAADDTFTLSVSNEGNPIPEEFLPKLFEPFFTSTKLSKNAGLGLGLYISSEIARAHGGTLKAYSSSAETRFEFKFPLVPAAS
jgi:signal transduction histidine kinase